MGGAAVRDGGAGGRSAAHPLTAAAAGGWRLASGRPGQAD
jgi:hypothetical protein